jgi:hypothetical protein
MATQHVKRSINIYATVKKVLYVLLILIVLLAAAGWWLHEPRPTGNPGPAADALAKVMMQSVRADAWDSTGAVQWTFAGTHHHLWDRERHLAQVSWGDNRVLLPLSTREGVAFASGTRVPTEQAQSLLQEAWEYWVNDAFWLNPVVKAFDEGTQRALVETESGGQALLVSYASGGATPGDAYLWQLDPTTKRPQAWQMWVSVIPIGGLSATWEGWQQLETGAWVATKHGLGPVNLTITDVGGAATLSALVGQDDPFAPLFR